MIRTTTLAATIGCLALAGCGNSEPAPAPSPTPTIAAPRTLVGADLDLSTLGAKIVGPQGPEVETVLSAGNRQIGTLVSYVACPAGTPVCEPGEMPAGTVYTYVHAITLVDAEVAAEDPVADASDLRETPPTLFRTLRAATGFNQAVGYSTAEAEAALGDPDAISITNDNGSLIWRVVRGSGWQPGGTVTLWWQSTTAPQGPAEAYQFELDGQQVATTGPFPPENKPVEGSAAR
ncbi:hypothetical protein N6L26_04000 [Qipengyuania sp. SS22]|uniref:hypothetical protein n=1 Tax=Qipengyuania sp. SS22 TaxID=2979461 RepID=UPI0021E5E386|nr:hypothetical protein [Qipengyuania sp. SS22]UYH55729.1 hypothetical protein N6L26_04000 [Qipengyuania sp. SS22]